MSEIIVKMEGDRIKLKGGQYVQNLVRCRDCKKKRSCVTFDGICNDDGFCSLAEARE